jgi:hypothetical protein
MIVGKEPMGTGGESPTGLCATQITLQLVPTTRLWTILQGSPSPDTVTSTVSGPSFKVQTSNKIVDTPVVHALNDDL